MSFCVSLQLPEWCPQLLRLYGFAGENNPWDFAHLQLDLSALRYTNSNDPSNQVQYTNGVEHAQQG